MCQIPACRKLKPSISNYYELVPLTKNTYADGFTSSMIDCHKT